MKLRFKRGSWKGLLARADRYERAESRFDDAGDTLVEILLALIVLGLTSVALLIAFSTSISASAEHRTLATSDIALSAVSQQAIASIDSQLNLFTACESLTYYQSHVQLIPSTGTIPSGYTPTLTNVQYWNPSTASFGAGFTNGPGNVSPSCALDQPEEITITVTHNGEVFTNSFVVDYPLAGATTQSTAGAAQSLIWSTAPSTTALTSTPFTQQPALEIEDGSTPPQAVTTDLSPVIISIESGPSGALTGCTGSESNGIVSFTGCELTQAGTYTLMATDGNLTTLLSNDPTITVTGSTTPYLVFTTEPSGGASGAVLGTEPVLQVDVGGSLDASWNGTVSLSTSGGVWPTGSPCSTVTITNGKSATSSSNPLSGCTFQGGLFYDPVSNETLKIPYTMSASGTGLIPTTSTAFTVTGAGSASQLVFATQPSGVSAASASTAFASQPVVDIEDAFGNVVTSSNATVTLTLNSNSFGASLSGCSSTTSNGAVTFSGCQLNKYGTGFTIQAASTGLPSIQSSPFNITGLPYAMQFTTQPAAGASGSTLPTQPVITIYDANGLIVTASTTPISLTSSGGSLTLCSNLTPYQGVVTVATCNFAGIVGTNYTLTATQGSVSVTSTPISPTVAGVATKLAFTTQPVGGVAGSALTTQPIVKVEDSAGNVVLTSSAPITLAVAPTSGTLSSCGNLQAVAGVANIGGCVFGGVLSTQYAMTATSAGLASATSSNFFVTAAGPIEQIILSGCTTDIQWNVSCTATATGEDTWGNIATTYSGGFTFAQTGGSGAVTGLTTVPAANAVASDTLTGSIVGAVTIDATGSTIVSNSATFNVLAIPQTVAITSTAPAGKVYSGSNGQSYVVTDTGGASGNPVVLSIDASSTSGCTVAGTTVNYGVGVGTCVIDANQAGNAHYAVAPQVQQTFNIGQATPTVSIANLPASGVYQGSFTASYTVTAGDAGATSVTSNTTSICTVSGNTVTYVGVGTCSLTSHVAATTDYTAASGTAQTFGVTQATPTVSISNLPVSGLFNGSFVATYTVSAGDAGATSVTSNSTSVCTVSGNTVTYVGIGTCSLTAHVAVTTDFTAATGTAQTFSVGQATPTVSIANLPASGVYQGSFTASYTVTAGDAGATSVTSNSTSVCTVSGNVVTYVGVGTCSLTAHVAATTDYAAAAGTAQTFSVGQATPTVSISNLPASGLFNGSFVATYTVTAGDAGATSVTSNSTSVCTVSGNTVTYVGIGTCSLTAHVATTTDYAAGTGTAQTFSVGQATQTITYTSTAPAGKVYSGSNGQSYTPTATGGASGNAVSFTIDGTSTSGCTITAGVVKYGVGVGTCVVDANQTGNTDYSAAPQVQQTFSVGQATPTVSIANLPASGVYNGSFTATYTVTVGDAGATSVTSNSTSVCTVSGNTVTYVGVGTCSLTAHVAATTDYAAGAGTAQTFSVGQATPTVSIANLPASDTFNDSFAPTYLVTANDAGVTSVTSNSTSICTVSGSTVTYVGIGTCSLTAHVAATTDFTAANGTPQTFSVGKGSQAITFTSTTPAAIYSGSNSQSYTPTATGGGSGNAVTFTIDGTSTSGCAITAGVVKYGSGVGTCVIDANQTGNTDYLAAPQAQQSFNVLSTSNWSSTGTTTDVSPTTTNPGSGAPVLILVTFESNTNGATCHTPTGASISTYSSILASTMYDTTGTNGNRKDFYMCAFSGVGTGTAGSITDTFTATTTFTGIQVVAITGDNSATFNLEMFNNGSSAAPSWLLSGTPPAQTDEFLFGALTNGGTEPTWTAIAGFASVGTPLTLSPGTTSGYVSTVYFGTPSASPVAGGTSATASWGALGIEVTP